MFVRINLRKTKLEIKIVVTERDREKVLCNSISVRLSHVLNSIPCFKKEKEKKNKASYYDYYNINDEKMKKNNLYFKKMQKTPLIFSC